MHFKMTQPKESSYFLKCLKKRKKKFIKQGTDFVLSQIKFTLLDFKFEFI